MTSNPPKSPRFVISVLEILIVTAIVSFEFSCLLPAVELGRERGRQPPLLPLLKPLHEEFRPWRFLFGTPVVILALVGTLMYVLRLLLPHSVRRYFAWSKPRKIRKPPIDPEL
jgi:hypothetical protein